MRNPHAGLPFTAAEMSDDAIAAALEDVSVPTLLLACVHIAGDASILDGPLRPQGLFLNEVQGFMSEPSGRPPTSSTASTRTRRARCTG